MKSNEFIEALRSSDIKTLSSIQKSDLHNHATRGGNIRHFLTEEEINKIDFLEKFDTLDDMQKWYEKYIKSLFVGKEGFIKRIESAFKQAKEDSINPLVLSFGLGDVMHFRNNYKIYIETIKEIQARIYPNVCLIPEISFSREMCPKTSLESFQEVINYNFFKAIDLTGDENIDVKPFIPLFKLAKENGFICKAHVGEFSTAENVLYVCKSLELDEIQHGNSAATSEEVMRYLSENNIILHLCPSSNVRLNRIDSLANHPIRILYDNDVSVSINTDDMLIFNSSVSEEYLKLYQSRILSAEELNDTRLTSISRYLKNLEV